ncbi:unnamed protein product [Leptosia nina]|uniref:C2H2-type domain-containing protein n=1 Tax=Leptosia nina TaxID=320188 RepID=A0AAV1JP16_9NEOP
MTTDKVFILEKDLCRCCHGEGTFESLSASDKCTSYNTMLKECFNIEITALIDYASASTFNICPQCVVQLKAADLFKKQVLNCEERFYELYRRLSPDDAFEDTKVKAELEPIQFDHEYNKQNEGDHNTTDFKGESEDEINLNSLKKVKKKCNYKKKNQLKTEDLDVADNPEKNIEGIKNIIKLIVTLSTATPFRWHCNKFRCFHCDQLFNKMSELKQHNYEHYNVNSQQCVNNAKVKFEITDLSCKICPKSMATLDDFLDHAVIAHNQKYDVAIRDSIFAYRITDTQTACPECDHIFSFFGNLLSHLYKTHVKSGPFLCDACGKGFLTKFLLRNHLKSAHSDTMYNCKQCSQTFKTYGAYSYHIQSHKGLYACPQCPEKFSSFYLRKRHLGLVHDKSLLLTCELCSKTFVKYNCLKLHQMSSHHNDKPISCDLCDYKCVNKSYLNRHMLKHSNIRPFQCHICAKSFYRKEHLENHVRTHTNDKRYACKECEKRFVQSAALKTHVRVHHPNVDT